jgi:hypothetical protein
MADAATVAGDWASASGTVPAIIARYRHAGSTCPPRAAGN